ncbi:hypothetical protein HJC99_01850 [Candidatus Saccharibacteria bacterium]|nr:hypothetical protein [Candidatus Saccharibacteria bacterium]
MEPTIRITPNAQSSGDTHIFTVQAIGPGDTDYVFSVSLTGTVVAVWALAPAEAMPELAHWLVYSHGTSRAFPAAYWFDTFNSGGTLKDTVDLIANLGEKPFLHPAIRGRYAGFVGDETLGKLERLDELCALGFQRPFLRSLDDAFEYTQASSDLSLAPKDNANFLYRVCVLSVIVDHLSLGKATREKPGTLNAFDIWQEQHLGSRLADAVLVMRMVKRLRKQYPIHEHFALAADGVRSLRDDVVIASNYFSLRQGEPEYNWHQVITRFNGALDQMIEELEMLVEKENAA